jgi:hypothetical protein
MMSEDFTPTNVLLDSQEQSNQPSMIDAFVVMKAEEVGSADGCGDEDAGDTDDENASSLRA